MSDARTRSLSLIRKITAGAVLSLFILRGLSVLWLAAHLAASVEVGDLAFSATDRLHCEAPQDQASPPKQDKYHSGCCALCASLARDAFALSLVILSDATLSSPRESPSFPTVFSVKSKLARPPGWMATWSATSPPHTAL